MAGWAGTGQAEFGTARGVLPRSCVHSGAVRGPGAQIRLLSRARVTLRTAADGYSPSARRASGATPPDSLLDALLGPIPISSANAHDEGARSSA
jgi:hypothetical protein